MRRNAYIELAEDTRLMDVVKGARLVRTVSVVEVKDLTCGEAALC